MSRFGSDPLAFFDSVYQRTASWDVGGPQPAMAKLLADFPPMNPVLDVGCGSGDHAIHLAKQGFQVLGIDFVDTAIVQAQEKASALPPEVAYRLEFQVGDALQPSRLGRQFGSVVDSGFFHLFDPEQCDRYVEELARILLPGGRYYLLAFAIQFDIPNVPRLVSAEELQTRFSPEKGWKILDMQTAEFLSCVAPAPAIATCIERLQ